MRAWLFNADSIDWSTQIERAYGLLSGRAGDAVEGHVENRDDSGGDSRGDSREDPTLFPYHFLQSLLGRIGGGLVIVGPALEQPIGVGFLFPRRVGSHAREYTLRFHPLDMPAAPGDRNRAPVVPDARAQIAPDAIVQMVESQLGAFQMGGGRVVFYDPAAPHRYTPTYQTLGQVNIGRPSEGEAQAIRKLHQEIWGSAPEFLYPADIHSDDFRPGTSLIARVEDQAAGFLFGFYKFDGPALPPVWQERFRSDLRLESQTMGVLPAYRGMRIANYLKRVQADRAIADNIDIVHWTADPLQAPNGALNFGLLRAVAFSFYPDFYPFRNELNRVPASRFGLTWLVRSARVQEESSQAVRSRVMDLSRQPTILRVNDGVDFANFEADAPVIAFEIPANWTQLQQQAEEKAWRWRETTDALFSHYIGIDPGKYVVTGVGADGERRFLIAEQVNDALWARLGQGA